MASQEEKVKILQETDLVSKRLGNNIYAQFYVNVMKRIILNGNAFVMSEKARLTNLINNHAANIQQSKLDEFVQKRNILESFQRNVFA